MRWVALFAAVLLVCSSVPVLAADSPPEEPPSLAPASLEADPEGLPTAEDVSAGIDAIEREEADRKRWLETPEAVNQRQQSRFAFAGLASAQAKELLGELFSEQLAQLNSDPARFLGDARVLDVADETVATVSEEGDRSLLEAGIPIRTENEEGELRKVDLGLIETPNGFEPVNPLSEVSIPLSADEAVEVGEAGVSIAQDEAQARNAERFGEENVFYPEVLADTDLLISPISHGVEIFNLLRSADSPETFRFELDLPQGAELRADGGGATVVHAGEAITKVLPPSAVDAQGTDVPVSMRVEERSLIIDIEHREGDFAYPILLDPTIMENWYDDNWMEGMSVEALSNGAWGWTSSPPGHISYSTYCINKCWGQGRGLYLSAQEIRTYGANVFSHWSYSAPNVHSFIEGAYLGSFERDNHGCLASQYPQPHVYDGLWVDGNWNELHIDRAGNPGYGGLETWGRSVIIGLGTGSNSAYLACKRDIVLGAIGIWLDDWNTPQINSVSGVPSGWVKDVSMSVNASDTGLGVQHIRITQEGEVVVAAKHVNNCTGLHGSRCPTSHSQPFTSIGSSFAEGIRSSNVVAEDPVGKTSSKSSFTTMVDRSKPIVTLSGQLAKETEEEGSAEKPAGTGDELGLPVYNLTIKAEDGSKADPKDKRSGVSYIEVLLDEKKMDVEWTPEGCPAPDYSCQMTRTYKLLLSKDVATSGEHLLEVNVYDQVGNVTERNIEFEYFPATGMKDEYLMHYFPLPDGSGDENSEEHPDRPELAVNVMNGNLVYREQDIEVEGPGVDLEVERYYNSMLPTNENTEWGDGWTLAQTPDLEPIDTGGSPAPDEAELLESSGALEDDLQLPIESGAEKFDPELQATLTKRADGGFELTDETGESATSVVFDATGQTEALETEGYAKVDYDYEGGELSEIAVEDPGTAAYPSEAPPVPDLSEAPPIYVSSFGSLGSGNGQFERPGDIAFAANGDIWVVDSYNNRIQHFDSKGTYIGKFGSKGTSDGQFERPRGIEFDDEGNIWILDCFNGRLQKFNQAGQFLAKFGTFGSSSGKFSSPRGLARDAQGNLWVADTGNGRIQKFSSNGTFLKAAGTSGPGDLTEPIGIDVSYEGEVFVADRTQNRVVVFNSEGEYVRAFGTEGEGDGELNRPIALDLDPLGHVWVGEEVNKRVQRFDLQGNYVDQFGDEGSDPGEMNPLSNMGITTDAEGSIWLTDSGNHRVQKWAFGGAQSAPPAAPPSYATTFGSNGSSNGQFKSPADIAVDPQGNLWVADKSNNRIQKFDSSGKFLSSFGSLGSGNGQYNRPSSIAVDHAGNVLVADSNNHRIQKLSLAGAFISKFGSSGSGNGQFNKPEEVVVDAEDNIWVADTQNGRVQKFNAEGEFMKVVDAGQLYEPTGMDVDPSGNLWIADWQKSRLSVFDGEGEFESNYGSSGSGNGQFNRPDAVEIDPSGNVWVGDLLNSRVQLFDFEGQYVGQFGSAGSGAGQFSLDYPMGIATNIEGDLWVTDVLNHRLQKWELENPPEEPVEPPAHADAFGSGGTGDGQLDHPGDVVVALDGDIWVADTYNNRIQHFDPEGNYLGKFGSTGTGNGQFERPRGIEFDAEGNIWVLDSLNERLQKFSEGGQFNSKWGSYGSAEGKLDTPKAFAIDASGNFWVADTSNARIQKFSPTGTFLKVAGTSGPGDLSNPVAIDVSAQGEVFVVDRSQNRVVVFNGNGEYQRAFGTEGDGVGEFDLPLALDVDDRGSVWVADELNKRVQQFDPQGNYLSKFGDEGSGEGEMDPISPMGMTTDKGSIWLADSGNNRIQQYEMPPAPPTSEELLDDDPEVQVEVASDLVTEVVGEEAGEHSYEHEGNDLTAYEGPDGESAYEYDAQGRMTKVTLPNDTYASITYFSDGRVKSVTVAPEGYNAKTTNFEYSDEPRLTFVEVGGAPNITYDIGEDGSIFKWWNTQEPPKFELSGTLYTNANEDGALWWGDHKLRVEAESPEGIASIQVIANGNQLVDEKTCAQIPGEPVECVNDEAEWITHSDSHAPGHLDLEVVVTDEDGYSSSERFWVDIPEPPPIAPGALVPPKFADVARFREEYGLEVVFPVKTERELNERILNLIKDWYDGDPRARATMERWGVPLRSADVAELEYRQWYVGILGSMLENWGVTEHPSTYAGYYVNHSSGGVIKVGFTSEQAASLAAFTQQMNPPAQDRLQVYPAPASIPIVNLVEKEELISVALESSAALRAIVTEIWVDYTENNVKVGATDVSQVSQLLQQVLGSLSGIHVVSQPSRSSYSSGRNRTVGRMLAGDRILIKESDASCTAGFGAYEKRPQKSNGEMIIVPFLLTAGHCFARDIEIWRSPYAGFGGKNDWTRLGQVTRSPYEHGAGTIDAEAIRLETEGLAPRRIYGHDGNRPKFEDPMVGYRGQRLCFSGATTGGVRCGNVVGIRKVQFEGESRPVGSLKIDAPNIPGDSGGPIWDPRTGAAVGLLRGYEGKFTWTQPLLDTPNNKGSVYRGALEAAQMFDLHLMTGG